MAESGVGKALQELDSVPVKQATSAPVAPIPSAPVSLPTSDPLKVQRALDVAGVPRKVAPVTPGREFHAALTEASAAHPYGSSVTPNDPAFYEQIKTFLNETKNAGLAVTPEGDIVSVFRHPDSPKNAIAQLMEQGIASGGKTLDAFNTTLPSNYSKYGFRPTSKLAFDPEYAPAGWDYERYGIYQGGRPDVVFMAHRPDLTGDDIAKQIENLPYSVSYEDAKAAQREALNVRIQEDAVEVPVARGGLGEHRGGYYEGAGPEEASGLAGGRGPYVRQAGTERVEAGLYGGNVPARRERLPLTEPPTNEAGQVTLYHWGLTPDLSELDPNFWGKNASILSRGERNRIGDAPGRTYFGISPGEEGGYRKELGLGEHKYQTEMPLSEFYHLDADPLGLRPSAMRDRESVYEKSIRDAGYSGYWLNHPDLGMVAVSFKPTRVRKAEKRGGSIDRAVKLARQHKTPDWQRAAGKNPEGGLNAKGRASYNRDNPDKPGLKRPQPEGGARRDSFCSRMEGVKDKLTSKETASDPNSRINKSLRAWNC